MRSHVEVVERFYRALAARDPSRMIKCYHPAIHFTDEVFDLHGPAVGAMWGMLCERGKDLEIEHRDVWADERTGRAHWDATYTFSATGRKVHNSIDSRFKFRDGRIVRHVDAFDFWSWSRQALGLPGLLFGWSGFLKARVARQAGHALAEFREEGWTSAIKPQD